MCFSSQASFLAGTTLVMIGLACVHRVHKTRQFTLLPLALTPLLFGIQQFLEGTLWLGLLAFPVNKTLYALGLHGFLWFALFWWPCWLPFALAYAESDTVRKRVMQILACAGAFLGIYLMWPPYGAEIIDNHITYTTSHWSVGGLLAYLICGVVPFFISSLSFIWLTGFLSYIGLLVTLIAYFGWTTSIWCFFVSLISSGIYLFIRRTTKH